MKKSITKMFILLAGMAGLLFIVGCSGKAPSNTTDNSVPELVLSPGDLTAPVGVVNEAGGRVTLQFKFSEAKADEILKFTQAHTNETAPVLIGTNTILGPYMQEKFSVSDGNVEVLYPGYRSTYAQQLAALLNKK